jgi:putative ABC transport system substrate-binding protein
MKRRDFVTLLGGAATWPLAARAQQPLPVIGWLSSRSAATDALVMPAFQRALNAQGFFEGRNVTIEYRHADAQLDSLSALAADLVSRRPALIIVAGDSARGTAAVQAMSAAVPILTFVSNEAIKAGIVAALNRPGGNVTGVMSYHQQVVAKRLGLLRDLLPRATKIAVLHQTDLGEGGEQEIEDVQEAARSLALQATVAYTRTPSEIDVAFANLAQQRPDALFLTTSPLFFTRLNQIVTASTRLALPTSFFRREFVAAGGLMSYASSPADNWRVVGEYAGRILKGEKAGDLPVQVPTKFELVLNLITAKALDLTVPTSMLLLADEVIE